MVICADELNVCGVELAPAATTSTYAPCTLSAPGALPVSTPLAMVANEGLDNVHSVLEVTSCVVPSLRCAVACSVTAPPTFTADGVALIDKESRLWEDGLLQPAARINQLHSSPKQTCEVGEIRMVRPREVKI
jgi:hypothetical protein